MMVGKLGDLVSGLLSEAASEGRLIVKVYPDGCANVRILPVGSRVPEELP